MLAYAPRRERSRLNAYALALIIGTHVVAMVAVMTAKMDVPVSWKPARTNVTFVPLPPDPKPDSPPKAELRPSNQSLDSPVPIIDASPAPGPVVDVLPLPPFEPGPVIAPDPPTPLDPPVKRTGPRFATPDGDIRPPYPESKRALEQEAVLRLRLSIDERGRVIAVDPVGRADATFLATARRHILRAWRYKPAMEGDKAMPSSTVITLQFELD